MLRPFPMHGALLRFDRDTGLNVRCEGPELAALRPGGIMDIKIWNAFASNNSGSYVIYPPGSPRSPRRPGPWSGSSSPRPRPTTRSRISGRAPHDRAPDKRTAARDLGRGHHRVMFKGTPRHPKWDELEIRENNPDSVLSQRIWSTAYLGHNYGKSTIG